jgi:outer membrane protein assembly factor BamB
VLWQFSDPNMGKTHSKPTVIRVKDAGTERWLAVFASGALTGSDVGDTVYAVDLATGALVWKFDLGDSNAYISTDITATETDDETEPDSPEVDGYIDRLFFADNKGRIWKLNPGTHSGTTITPIGSSVSTGLAAGAALFSTQLTPGALGAQRAIAGTIAAAPDGTGRLVLFFGTGGTDDTPNDVQNAFYAVYADDGTIRSTLSPAAGVKFYGGVVYNAGQLIFTEGQDLSGLGLCSPTAGKVVVVDANTFAVQFEIPTSSKIVAPVFAAQGKVYTVTLKGEVVTTQSSTPPAGGTGGTGGSGGGPGAPPGAPGGGGSAREALVVLGWRQMF